MRPPKLKWQKTADAFEQLFDALQGVVTSLPQVPGAVVGKLDDARKAVAALKEHVSAAEECEMD